MSLRPRNLPKVRDQILRQIADPASHLRRIGQARSMEWSEDELCAAAPHLRASEMYWVAPDMSALAISAGKALASATWAAPARPAPSGLLVWGEGISLASVGGIRLPVDACGWGPGPGGDMTLTVYVSRTRLATAIPGYEALYGKFNLDLDALIPPLVPLGFFTLPGGAEPFPFADLTGAPRPLAAALAAAWLLMEQPTLVERVRQEADKPVRRAYAREGRPEPEVTILDLRRIYRPEQPDEGDGGQSGREYRFRWVVSGHWRDQPWGPRRSLRRQQWIPAYTKGPDGAPLLKTERVNVWRR